MSKFLFFKEGLKQIKTTGSIIPSSKFLVKKMLKYIDFESKNCVVELGAGDGVFTKKILQRMNTDSTLVSFEINPKFIQELETIEDNRLVIAEESAENITNYIEQYNFQKADVIISGLPFVAFDDDLTARILEEAYDALPSGGKMVQFNYSLLSKKHYKRVFDKVETHFTPLNVPPAFVFECIKA